ncbi:unnamed protein product [Staurois parvus]|uniref:Uncharacterized protein n=1 Tax=Staurois parvus TaxID=386267 RepID=A0ABN9BE85_9NEOB|nr:unnamed protein product [Staurois parvus]
MFYKVFQSLHTSAISTQGEAVLLS